MIGGLEILWRSHLLDDFEMPPQAHYFSSRLGRFYGIDQRLNTYFCADLEAQVTIRDDGIADGAEPSRCCEDLSSRSVEIVPARERHTHNQFAIPRIAVQCNPGGIRTAAAECVEHVQHSVPQGAGITACLIEIANDSAHRVASLWILAVYRLYTDSASRPSAICPQQSQERKRQRGKASWNASIAPSANGWSLPVCGPASFCPRLIWPRSAGPAGRRYGKPVEGWPKTTGWSESRAKGIWWRPSPFATSWSCTNSGGFWNVLPPRRWRVRPAANRFKNCGIWCGLRTIRRPSFRKSSQRTRYFICGWHRWPATSGWWTNCDYLSDMSSVWIRCVLRLYRAGSHIPTF